MLFCESVVLLKRKTQQGEQSNEEANEPDMANPDTWLKVPTDKPLIVGVPSRTKPRERGKKSLYDF